MNKYSVYSIAKFTDWRLAASRVWPRSVFHSSQPLAERPIKAMAAMLGLVSRWSRPFAYLDQNRMLVKLKFSG